MKIKKRTEERKEGFPIKDQKGSEKGKEAILDQWNKEEKHAFLVLYMVPYFLLFKLMFRLIRECGNWWTHVKREGKTFGQYVTFVNILKKVWLTTKIYLKYFCKSGV